MSENRDRVAAKLGLTESENGLALSKQSLLVAIGGPLGIAEAVLPAFVFSLAFAISKSAIISVSSAAGLAVVFIAWRFIRKQNATQALVGAGAILLAAYLALRDGGNAQDYFVPGFITNAAYGSVLLLSVLARYPVMGFVVQFLFGKPNWRSHRETYKRVRLVTVIWVGFFALRLAIQLPLYYSAQVELLAASRIIMGAPAYAGLLALTWVLLRRIAQAERE